MSTIPATTSSLPVQLFAWLGIDVTQPMFHLACLFIVFNPLLWNALGRFEYDTKRVSKLFGSAKRGVYFAAFLIFTLGLIRDYVFQLAIYSNRMSPALWNNGVYLAGSCCAIVGLVLVFTSMYQLGIVGTYLGDYFGILFDQRITAFPFSHFEHPMYQGATMAFLGWGLIHASPAGIFLACLAALVYTIATRFEGPFTTMIYQQAHKAKHIL